MSRARGNRIPSTRTRFAWDADVEYELDAAEAAVQKARKSPREQLAGSRKRARVNRKAGQKVRKNRVKAPGKKKKAVKRKRFTLAEARKKFEGVNEAVKAYKKFHGKAPSHVDVYVIEDGSDQVTVDRTHAALHRTIDTNYFVPWESSKRGTLWKHEHVEGYDLFSDKDTPEGAQFPLEILDPATGTTRKILGRFKVEDWWYD